MDHWDLVDEMEKMDLLVYRYFTNYSETHTFIVHCLCILHHIFTRSKLYFSNEFKINYCFALYSLLLPEYCNENIDWLANIRAAM